MDRDDRFGPPPDLGNANPSSLPDPGAPSPAPGPGQGVERADNPLDAETALQSAARNLGLDQAIEAPPVFNSGSVSLPKGGGAIRAIAEAFQANPVTGTGSTSVPLPVTPARGLEPQLALRYDSGAGAGPFGLGWSLGAGRISRKTDRGLPRYRDTEDSDTYTISDAEDLVPLLEDDGNGNWASQSFTTTESGIGYSVYRYRPRVEAAFSRIERWVADSGGDVHWRTRDRSNVVRVYGRNSNSRLADPADSAKVFSWLLCEVADDRGNRMLLDYLEDSEANLTAATAPIHDAHRADGALSPFTQRYLKQVRYGNATPHSLGSSADDFLFALAFDYGAMDDRNDAAAQAASHLIPDLSWSGTRTERSDPFSSYRAGFEIRTRFRCERIVLFHGVDDRVDPTATEGLDTGEALAVRAWTLAYDNATYLSKLVSVTQIGFRTESSAVSSLEVPPASFTYQAATTGTSVRSLDAGDIDALPRGVDARRFQWHDLDGEGLVGILTESGGAWWYRRNLGAPERWDLSVSRPRIGPRENVPLLPSALTLARGAGFADLDGDGRAELVLRQGAVVGSHKRTDDGWAAFVPFEGMPNVDWSDPALRFVDLTGDGRADLLLTENDVHRWWPSEGTDGFGPQERVLQALDEAQSPQVVFGDDREAVYLADMTGDGLQDLVRVRNSAVVYWPNLGYGRFGAKITLGGAPLLDRSDRFDPRRVRLVDVDGSGPADLLYLGSDAVQLAVNEAGNVFADPVTIPFPRVNDPSLIDLVDLNADGTLCLVQRPSPTRGPGHQLLYVPLMEAGKPHLLNAVDHGQGSETRLQYAPSTKFYVNDRDAGTPWATKLPFPVQVLERVEVRDHLREHRIVQRYAYHHGFYDGVEREFRGFGMVEQFDTERFFDLGSADWFDESGASGDDFVAPVVTKTWFHTGAFFENETLADAYAAEYYDGDASAASLPAPEIVDVETLAPGEIREARRALKGRVLRQEVWDDEGGSSVPYVVRQSTYVVERLQPRGDNPFASFRVDATSTHSATYDAVEIPAPDPADPPLPPDPRVTQSLLLEVDALGTPLLSAKVVFGRRNSGDFGAIDLGEQQDTHVVFVAREVKHDDGSDDRLRLAIPLRQRAFKLTMPPTPATPELYTAGELNTEWSNAWPAPPSEPDVSAHNALTTKALQSIAEQFVRYVDETTIGGTQAPMSEGEAGELALVHQVFTLAMTKEDSDVLNVPAAADWGTNDTARTTMLEDEGGYVVGSVEVDDAPATTSAPADPKVLSGFGTGLDAWAVSGTTTYGTSSQFYRANSQTDPFEGATTTLTWDSDSLTVTNASVDFGGTEDHDVAGTVDLQTRQPDQVTDPNGVIREVQYDALGRVVKARLVGDDALNPMDSWAQPTAQTDYVFASYDSVSDTWTPGHAHVYARIEHNDIDTSTDPVDTSNTAYLQSRTYFDGLGRELMTKAQAAPDAATPTTARFVGSGRVVLNNKELPVKQYEPFFATSWDFETEAAMSGVSPELHYDPVGRVVRVDQPDGTALTTEHGPWRTRSWNEADNIPDQSPPSPETPEPYGWYDATPDGSDWDISGIAALTATEKTALEDAVDDARAGSLGHRDTPTIVHLDSLGRPFLQQRAMASTTDDGNYTETTDVRVTYDVLGRATKVEAEYRVLDATSATVTHAQLATEIVYDLGGRPLKSIGRDEQTEGSTATTGTRYALPAMDGQMARSWDSRDNAFRSTYDGLRRPESTYIKEGTATEYRHTHVRYGTDATSPKSKRLLGRAWELYDASGKMETTDVDDDGNVLSQTKWFVAGYRTLPDWTTLSGTGSPDLVLDPRATSSAEAFEMETTWDALGRPKTETLYRGTRTTEDSTRAYTYDAGGRLLTVVASCAGQADETILRSVTYNARGQRLVVERGTKTGSSPPAPSLTTTYLYDSNMFRILRIYTERDTSGGTSVLQDLRYVHDAVGNVTARINAHDHTVWFNNQPVSPDQTFSYDALDRLVEATGREHDATFNAGEGGFGVRRQKNVPYGRGPHAHPNDGNSLRTYTQTFAYDAVGNLASVVHNANSTNTTRTYRYTDNSGTVVDAASSQPFQPLFNNQLAETKVGSTTYALTYDEHGNMDLPHLVAQSYSPLDRLHSIQATASWSTDGDTPTALSPTQDHDWFYVYAADGQRARKVRAVGTTGATRSEERFYLGAFEVWREYQSANQATATTAGVPDTERETWHVSDDKGRLAMGETKTWSSGAAVGTPTPRWRLQNSDHLHTTSGEVTETAAIISYEEYHPYGTTAFQSVDSSIDVSRKRYRYTGMERDDETGLHYHQHRYYAPWLGRWTRPDPAGLVDGPGRFSYVGGNPVGGRDPSGLARGGRRGVPPGRGGWRKIPTKRHKPRGGQLAEAYQRALTRNRGDWYSEPGAITRPGSQSLRARSRAARARQQRYEDALWEAVHGEVLPTLNRGETLTPRHELILLEAITHSTSSPSVRPQFSQNPLPIEAFAYFRVLERWPEAIKPAEDQSEQVESPSDPEGWLPPGPVVEYENLLPGTDGQQLAAELATAARLGVSPAAPGSKEFDETIDQGRVKWAVTTEGEVLVVPFVVEMEEIHHTVITGGGNVIAAGTAQIAGTAESGYIGLEIDAESGHYRPDRRNSIEIGSEAFRRRGISFEGE